MALTQRTNTNGQMSAYFLSLKTEIQERYSQKVLSINSIDPYTLKNSNFGVNYENLPVVQITDIVIYFVATHSFYSGKQIKAYKSLEAFEFYTAGFISQINYYKINEHFVVVGKVKHSQRMNEAPVDAWIILLSDGAIWTAHCTCMAGLGEACSHVAAIAFYVLLHRLEIDPRSCTDQLALWPIPATAKSVGPKKIKDMDWGNPIKSYEKALCTTAVALEDNNLFGFLAELDTIHPTSAILSVIEPFAAKRIPVVQKNIPNVLTDLYDPVKYQLYSLDDLRKQQVVQISIEEQKTVSEITIKQSKSSLWFKHKAGRITASNFKNVCSAALDKPPLSLIKNICYSQKMFIRIKAISYGIEHESQALRQYFKSIKSNHINAKLSGTGLVISTKNSVFAATPDGIIFCDCCGKGCVEAKCPYRLADENLNLEEFAQLPDTCIKLNPDGKYALDKNHSYYFQVQLQMYVTETQYCDFIIWSKYEMRIERITYDDRFVEEKIVKAKLFHSHVIMPELLIRWYAETANSVAVERWCTCNGLDDGTEMVQCANSSCKIKRFHMQCVNLMNLPLNSFWFCQACSLIIKKLINKNN